MGFFGNGGNSGAQQTPTSAADNLIIEQFNQNKKEIEEKRKIIQAEKLDIIHSQGGQSWEPSKGAT